MTKANCPALCGKRFIDANSAEKHADAAHPEWRTPRQKGWATPYGFVDFAEPVTYEEACKSMALFREAFAARMANLSKDQPTAKPKE